MSIHVLIEKCERISQSHPVGKVYHLVDPVYLHMCVCLLREAEHKG